MRILLVDNYDSFTWNIEHILVSAGARVDVVRNDAINPHAVVQFDGLVLSPGPGVPDEAGQLMRIIPIAAAHSVPQLLTLCPFPYDALDAACRRGVHVDWFASHFYEHDLDRVQRLEDAMRSPTRRPASAR